MYPTAKQIYFRVRWRWNQILKGHRSGAKVFLAWKWREGPGFQPADLRQGSSRGDTRVSKEFPRDNSHHRLWQFVWRAQWQGPRWSNSVVLSSVTKSHPNSLQPQERPTTERLEVSGLLIHSSSCFLHYLETTQEHPCKLRAFLTYVKILQDSTPLPLPNCPSSIHSFKKSRNLQEPHWVQTSCFTNW